MVFTLSGKTLSLIIAINTSDDQDIRSLDNDLYCAPSIITNTFYYAYVLADITADAELTDSINIVRR